MKKQQATKAKQKETNETKLQKLLNAADELIQQNHSIIQQNMQEIEWEMGIDEAGRGPVLGPMVYGCCVWPKQLKEELGKLGFADSKQLTNEQRDNYFEILKKLEGKLLFYKVRIIQAQEISNLMLGVKNYSNLNQISFSTAYFLIEYFKLNITHVYIDTVGKSDTYQSKLYQDFGQKYPNMKFTVAEKADSKFPVVSAASIAAKVTRDLEIENLQQQFCNGSSQDDENSQNNQNQVGSGYPADPNTKRWLKNNFHPIFAYPLLVRYSWSTIQKLMEENNLNVLFYEDNPNQLQNMFSNQKQKRPYIIKELNINSDFEL